MDMFGARESLRVSDVDGEEREQGADGGLAISGVTYNEIKLLIDQ